MEVVIVIKGEDGDWMWRLITDQRKMWMLKKEKLRLKVSRINNGEMS